MDVKIFYIKRIIHLFLFLCFLTQMPIFGQDLILNSIPINCDEAIKIALERSMILSNEKLKNDYLSTMQKTAFEIPNTEFSTELGQFNSNLLDTKIGVQQNIKNPIFYKKTKELYEFDVRKSIIEKNLMQLLIAKEVEIQFNNLIYFNEKLKLLQKTDSIFIQILSKISLNLTAGEKNKVDWLQAKNQQDLLKIQKTNLEFEYKQALSNFRFLLNATDKPYLPVSSNFELDFTPEGAIENISNLFNVKLLTEEAAINSAKIAIENSKKLPDLTAGIYMQSFRFNTPNESNYLGTVGQMGLSFPFFNSSIKHKTTALKINQKIIENKISIEKKQLNQNYQELLNKHESLKKQAQFYQQTILKNANELMNLTQKQFELGEISVFNFLNLEVQNQQNQNSFIDLINNLNKVKIELKYQNNN